MINYYKFFDTLRRKGVKQSDILAQKIISSSTLTHMRRNETITTESINTLCNYLGCRIEDICEYVPDETPDK